MTPQERQLIDDLFARLSKLEGAPRDPDATAAITQGLRSAPNAVYALVQTVLVQDEALRQAHNRIEELEGADARRNRPRAAASSIRCATRFSDRTSRKARCRTFRRRARRPSGVEQRTGAATVAVAGALRSGLWPKSGLRPGFVWSGLVQSGLRRASGGPMGGAFGGGGSFLGTAAAAAAGVVGGSLLLNSFRGMMGGQGGGRSAFGDTSRITENRRSVARSVQQRSRARRRDQRYRLARPLRWRLTRRIVRHSSNDDDHDDMDMDSDDDGSDYA